MPGLKQWHPVTHLATMILSLTLLSGGCALALAGVIVLGKHLTPLPVPKNDATLITSGVYRLVRHPIYSGISLLAFGWGIWLQNLLVLLYAMMIFMFFEIKSRKEEQWLVAKFPEYVTYQKRVRRIIPFIY
jgi:protein-S-isoprenylcysteine O-methyltransferase Ste14